MNKKISLIAFILVVSDIIIKLLINSNLELLENIVIIRNFFNITKVYNMGASWNILAGHRYLIIIITLGVLFFLLKYQKKFCEKSRNIWAFGLVYGGVVGNLIDRIVYGYVIDYLDFTIGSYHYPVFNLADIGIVIGIFLLLVAILKKEDECGS